jgi:hypothetical protein
MKLRTFFILNAIVLGGSGVSAVLMPARVCSLYGVDVNPQVLMMAQYAGLGSIAVALVAWFIRQTRDPIALRGVTLALLITYVVGVIISVRSTISGIMPSGWSIVAIYSAFAIGYAYFLLKGRFAD